MFILISLSIHHCNLYTINIFLYSSHQKVVKKHKKYCQWFWLSLTTLSFNYMCFHDYPDFSIYSLIHSLCKKPLLVISHLGIIII